MPTPNPAWLPAMLIRAVFDRGAWKTVKEMRPHVPETGVRSQFDLPYADAGLDTTLDIFTPDDSAGPLPTIVWIHGGAWISGGKADVTPYVKMLAARGFTTVGLDYSIAPEEIYPTALRQLNTALGHLNDNHQTLRIDPHRIVLAGDSAGAQLAAQLALIITNPLYAAEVDLVPALSTNQLQAVVLHCGIYDLETVKTAGGVLGWGFRTALRAYIGARDWFGTAGRQLSIIEHVTAAFPPTFISGGNADPLTNHHSRPLAARLAELGVAVEALFYPDDQSPELTHEYQFHLNDAEAHQALDQSVAFLTSLG